MSKELLVTQAALVARRRLFCSFACVVEDETGLGLVVLVSGLAWALSECVTVFTLAVAASALRRRNTVPLSPYSEPSGPWFRAFGRRQERQETLTLQQQMAPPLLIH